MVAKRLPLGPLREGEIDVWVMVCVRLTHPLAPENSDDPPAVGFFQNLGIRMAGPQPKSYLEKIIPDGRIDWDETESGEIDPNSLDPGIRESIGVPDSNGVWYKSGRMLFPADDAG